MSETRSLSATEARKNIAEIINEADYTEKRTVITKHGQEKAAVIPIDDYRVLLALDQILDTVEAVEALAQADSEGTENWDDLKEELGLSD